MFGLGKNELKILKKLNRPAKIQDFLNAMKRILRKADKIEIEAGKLTEWKK